MRYSKESGVGFCLGACLCDLIYGLVYDTGVGEESGVMYVCNDRTGQEDVSSQNPDDSHDCAKPWFEEQEGEEYSL